MVISKKKTIFSVIIMVGVMMVIYAVSGGFKVFSNTPYDIFTIDTTNFNETYEIPAIVTFAGEKMPLDNFDTRESLER